MAKQKKVVGRDWAKEIERFSKGENKTRTIKMGSAGSASVTACRIRQTFDHDFSIRAKADTVIFER